MLFNLSVLFQPSLPSPPPPPLTNLITHPVILRGVGPPTESCGAGLGRPEQPRYLASLYLTPAPPTPRSPHQLSASADGPRLTSRKPRPKGKKIHTNKNLECIFAKLIGKKKRLMRSLYKKTKFSEIIRILKTTKTHYFTHIGRCR